MVIRAPERRTILVFGPMFGRLISVLSDQVNVYLKFMIYISAVYVVGQAISNVFNCGIFRAGGDTKFSFLCDLICIWGVIIPCGLIVYNVTRGHDYGFYATYLVLFFDEFAKMPFLFIRYGKKKWLNNITRDEVV